MKDNYDDDDKDRQKKITPVTDISGYSRTGFEKRKQTGEADELSEKESDALYERNLAEHNKEKMQTRVLLIVTALLLLFAAFMWRRSVAYVRGETLWVKDLKETGSATGLLFSEGIIRYNNDGMSYFLPSGEVKWTKTYEMHQPKPFFCGDYVVMADIGYSKIIICNTDGFQGETNSPLPVSTLSVSASGVVAAVVEDDLGNHILFFDRTGSKLEIDIRTLMDQSGYPLSVSFSPDGKMLMVSYVYLDQAVISNKLVFYNFQDSAAGSERMVGTFQNYGDTLFAKTQFLDDRHAVAFGDGKLVFFSLKNRLSPTQEKEITISHTMQKVFLNEETVTVVTKDEEKNNWKITVYNTSGSVELELESAYLPDYVGIKGGVIYYHNEEYMTVLSKNLRGYRQCFSGKFSLLRAVVNVKGDHTFLILSDSQILQMQLKK